MDTCQMYMQVLFLIVSPLPCVGCRCTWICMSRVHGVCVCVWHWLPRLDEHCCVLDNCYSLHPAAAGISIIVKKQLGEERVSSIIRLSPLSREVKVGIQGRSLNTASETDTKEECLQACSPCLVQLSFLYNSVPLAQCEHPVCALWVCPVP